MLSERDIELAHPDAFDFVFGTLPSGNAVWFHRHLDGCSYCQKVVGEYSDIGRIFQNLPPSRRAVRRPRRPDGGRNGHCPG